MEIIQQLHRITGHVIYLPPSSFYLIQSCGIEVPFGPKDSDGLHVFSDNWYWMADHMERY